MMTCKACGQVGDWLGADANWRPVNGTPVPAVGLFECVECGHRQLAVER